MADFVGGACDLSGLRKYLGEKWGSELGIKVDDQKGTG